MLLQKQLYNLKSNLFFKNNWDKIKERIDSNSELKKELIQIIIKEFNFNDKILCRVILGTLYKLNLTISINNKIGTIEKNSNTYFLCTKEQEEIIISNYLDIILM